MFCACGCNEQVDIWDDTCQHCGNPMIKTHEGNNNCCVLCSGVMDLMTTLYGKQESRIKLVNKFHHNLSELKEMPDVILVRYEGHSEMSSSSSERGTSKGKKSIYTAVISLHELQKFFVSWANNQGVSEPQHRITAYLIDYVSTHEEFKGNKMKTKIIKIRMEHACIHLQHNFDRLLRIIHLI